MSHRGPARVVVGFCFAGATSTSISVKDHRTIIIIIFIPLIGANATGSDEPANFPGIYMETNINLACHWCVTFQRGNRYWNWAEQKKDTHRPI